MSDPKTPDSTAQILMAIAALEKKHNVGLWIGSMVLALILGGSAFYAVLVSQVSDRLKTAQEATDTAVKAASDNEARLQALSDSLAAQSPSLKATLNAKLLALGFKAVSK